MLKDQNNPKVLAAINDIVSKSITEKRGDEVKVCALLSGRYSSYRPTQEINEGLSPKQKKIAKVAGHPGKIDAADFAALRAGHKIKENEDIVIDDELESLLEYEVVRVGGRRVNDEGESYDGKKVFGRRYSGGEGTPHAVHVNGKKWKTFSSQQHAQNVANKLTQQGKKATVHKEDIQLDDGEKLVEARFMKGQDVGKPGMNFSMIARKAAKKYGSKAAGQRVAGSILKKALNKEDIHLNNGPQLDEIAPALAGAAAVGARLAPLASRGVNAVRSMLSKTGGEKAAGTAVQAAASKTTPMMNTSRNATTGQFRPNAPKISDAQAFKQTPGNGLPMPTPGARGAIRAGAAGAAVGAGVGHAVLGDRSKEVPKPIDKNVADTMAKNQPPGAVQDTGKAAAPKKQLSDFEKAFAAARAKGDTEFKYTKDGKESSYTTRYKEEDEPTHRASLERIKARATKEEWVPLVDPIDGVKRPPNDKGTPAHTITPSKQVVKKPVPVRTSKPVKESMDAEPDHHIHVQLQKAADMKHDSVKGKEGYTTKGGADVKFDNGKHFVSAEHAHKVITALNKLRPADRAKMHAHIQQSHANFQAVHKLVS